MQIRRYQAGEETELWDIFFHTIRNVNIRDYSQEQVETWAPDEIDPDYWWKRIAGMNPFVCLQQEKKIVGYAALLESGYVDHFYVHHLHQGKGVGKRLMQEIETTATKMGLQELTSDVSITARPFFESRSFKVITPQEVTLRGVVFKNYKMKKVLKLN
ncbi:MAG: GNAT family N-acetyltransferase [Planctomicrobium sp.]|jgi:putative acetyltransferase|nr:GNAT family N-acetyltransferase [Planctomicrobium sp.]